MNLNYPKTPDYHKKFPDVMRKPKKKFEENMKDFFIFELKLGEHCQIMEIDYKDFRILFGT